MGYQELTTYQLICDTEDCKHHIQTYHFKREVFLQDAITIMEWTLEDGKWYCIRCSVARMKGDK